jgi:hypothetical protein
MGSSMEEDLDLDMNLDLEPMLFVIYMSPGNEVAGRLVSSICKLKCGVF